MTELWTDERTTQEAWWAEAMQDPERRERFAEVKAAMLKGDLTLAQVGGFSTDEIDAAYAGVCKLIATGKLREALQIAGYFILISPWEARHYYLAGVCLHRLNKPQEALQYYDVALAFDQGGAEDGVALLGKGEVLLMLGRRDEARKALQHGVRVLPTDDAHKPHFDRGVKLLSTYCVPEGGSQ